MTILLRGTMGHASQSVVLFIVFCFITTGTLSQSSPPTVAILSSKPTFGIVGQSKTIFCQVSGTRVSTVTWYFNGIPLSISSQYSWTQSLINGSADLTISALLKSDNGTYNCSVRNDAGTSSDSVVLSAEEILNVTVTSKTETGIVGQVKTLQCSITGTPITSVQWSFNGNTLTNYERKYYWLTSSTPNFYFDSLTIADAGMYTCSASNHAGANFASINLTVIARPVVTTGNSTGLSANEGENVFITCLITDTTTIDSLQWYFQNKFLYHSDPHYFWSSVNGVSIPFDGSLRIYNVTSQDKGTYKCHATNAAGVGEVSIDLFSGKMVLRTQVRTCQNHSIISLVITLRKPTESTESSIDGQKGLPMLLAIVAIVLGVLLAVSILLVVILSCCVHKYRKKREEMQRQQETQHKYSSK